MLKIWTSNNHFYEYDLDLFVLTLDDNWITLTNAFQGIFIHPWSTVVRLWHPDPEKLTAAVVT